ncbi:putative AC transposase [Bienertia sinuspersici]
MENDVPITGRGDVIGEAIDLDQPMGEDQTQGDINPFAKRQRKKTSWVWNHLEFVTHPIGTTKSGPTTQYKRHLESCSMHRAHGQQLLGSIENWKYDHGKVRELFAHMVAVHELPFMFAEYEVFNMLMKVVAPQFERISRVTLKNDCIASHDIEKKRTKGLLKQASKIHKKIEYMVLTCHFVIDFDLFINFVDIPPPHSRVAVHDALYKCLVEWEIENKLASIIVDNATYNDVVVRTFKDSLACQAILPYGGKLFHVRCCVHILNILVHGGLEEIKGVIHR